MNFFDLEEITTFEELKLILSLDFSENEIAEIKKAYEFAATLHATDLRASGGTFESHFLTVAKYIANLKLDKASIICALIHDTVSKDKTTINKIDELFGEEVAFIIDGLSEIISLSKNYNKEEDRLKEFKNLIFNSSDDIRIIIIRLADKLHNILTIDNLPEEKQKSAAEKILNIYAPLASYLGLGLIQVALEDNAFRIYMPKEYKLVKEKMDELTHNSEKILEDFQVEAKKIFSDYNLKYEDFYGRRKGVFSTYNKIKRKYQKEKSLENSYFEGLKDIHAFRLITSKIEECYIALGLLHSHYSYSKDDFRDYISNPKENGYKSVHTVLEYINTYLEVQIRTVEMHQYNEYGPASHIMYKFKSAGDLKTKALTWTKDMVGWKNDGISAKERFQVKAFRDSVFVFTPKGLVVKLREGSTPVDFAFRIHTNLGERYIGAKVNGKMENMSYILKTGDIVEILTGKKQNVTRDWLKFAKSPRAKSKIKKVLRDEN